MSPPQVKMSPPRVKMSPPRVKTSRSLIIIISYPIMTSNLWFPEEGVGHIYGQQVLREEQQEEDDV